MINIDNIEYKKPRSLGICMQFVALWAGTLDRAELVQLCAGAMGVCSNIPDMPHYRPSQGKPLDYGFACMEFLLENGITATNIYEKGRECLVLMSSALPSEKEVEDTANF
jgi:hypothetical protein